MATYVFSCKHCGDVKEFRVPHMEPPRFITCENCWSQEYMKRVYTAPHTFTHQTGAEWLNEVANGYGDPPAGMTREQGMAAARAKAWADKQMGKSGKEHPSISTASHPAMKQYIPE